MVYIDGTETCITAAQYAICLAKIYNAPLTAIYCVDEKALSDLLKAKIFIKEEAGDYEYELEEDGRRYLNHVKELANAKGVEVAQVLTKGEVNIEVLKKAEELNVDLLVMNEIEEFTSRRETFLDEKEKILRRAKCPTVIVKNEEKVLEMYNKL